MINLLSHDDLRQFKAARLNILLRRYVMLLGMLALFVIASFGLGYYILIQEEMSAKATIEDFNKEKATYAKDIEQAKLYTSNLAAAKSILNSEILLSDVVFQIANTLPKDSVVELLDLSTAELTKPITLQIMTTSYANAVNTKDAFEKSEYFENAIIANVSTVEEASDKFNTSLSLSVSLSTSKFTGGNQ